MNIQKEREAFEVEWVKLGGDFKSFTIVNNMYVLTNNAGDAGVLFKELAERAINSAFALWLIQARRKQCNIELLESEIEALKPQATPDGFVLVPKKEITDWYLDESEGMWLEELDHWACDLECGEVTVVDRLKVWPAADQFVAKVYIDEDNIELQLFDDEATAKRAAEYCKTMVLHDKQEAAEIFGAIVEAAENKESCAPNE